MSKRPLRKFMYLDWLVTRLDVVCVNGSQKLIHINNAVKKKEEEENEKKKYLYGKVNEREKKNDRIVQSVTKRVNK